MLFGGFILLMSEVSRYVYVDSLKIVRGWQSVRNNSYTIIGDEHVQPYKRSWMIQLLYNVGCIIVTTKDDYKIEIPVKVSLSHLRVEQVIVSKKKYGRN